MEQDKKNRLEQYYLGVARSVCGKSWRSRLDRQGENAALQMAQRYGLPDMVARVLAGRGVAAAEAQAFLAPSLRRLMPEPYSLQDMEKAAKRLAAACLRQETVAIFGDYDVDGACSAALLARFLTALGIKNRIYIPDRLSEGYGPNEAALRRLAAEGARLIITVDCGANSGAVFAAAKQAGANADIIALDHHQLAPAAALPQAVADFIHVNPNRPDDLSGLGYLSAAGVVFLCLVAVARLLRAQNVANIPDLLGLLDLVALATICDIVPLRGLNRAFVTKGLAVARSGHNQGLQALAQAAAIAEPLKAYHFSYVLGPRINAGGRIGDAALGAKLLTCDNAAEAGKIAAQLDSLNYGRQEIEAKQLSEALAQVEAAAAEPDGSAKMIFAVGDWHIGIAGLLAARLKECFGKPAFVMAARSDGQISGSARSVSGVDIGALVGQAVAAGLLAKGGGHKMAAGFSLSAANIPLFRAWLEQNLAAGAAAEEAAAEALLLDGSLTAGGATAALIEDLEKAGPYGAGHERPLFALPNHTITYIRAMGKGGAHLRLTLADGQGGRVVQAVAFRAAGTELGQFLPAHSGRQAHFAGTLSLNHWQGQTTPQFHILDAAEVSI